MSLSTDYVDVGEASRLLGVSKRQVARLGQQEQIQYLNRGLIARGSIEEYLSERRSSRTRPWSEPTAWAAIALLSGMDADWLGQVQTSRLRGRLRHLASDESGSQEFVSRARGRAVVRAYESFGFIGKHIKKDLVLVNRRGLGLSDSRRDELDGYVDATVLSTLVKRYGLLRDPRGAMILRSTHFDIDIVTHIARSGNGALAALDAAGSKDPRERGVGSRALAAHLQGFADG